MSEFKYRVVETAMNSVRISPYIGKRFSDNEYNEIKAIVDKSDCVSKSFRDGAGLRVLFKTNDEDMESLVSGMLPKVKTKSEIKREATEQKNNKIKKDKEDKYAALGKEESKAYAWANSVFGEGVLNNFNMASIVRFVTGRELKFEGLFNRRSEEGLDKIGALCELENGCKKIMFDKIKENYEEFVL